MPDSSTGWCILPILESGMSSLIIKKPMFPLLMSHVKSPSMKDSRQQLERLVCVGDFQRVALTELAPVLGEYFRGGADDEVTLKENSSAFLKWKILPRCLVDVSRISLTTNVLGKPVAIPFGVSPTALHGLAHPKGELATAKAAERLGSIYCQSIMSNNTFKEVEAVAPGGRRWAQLYLLNNQSETEILIRKAENAGVEALVITIDGPYYGKRRGCIRHPFDFPSRLRMPNLDFDGQSNLSYEKILAFSDEQVKSSATWDDIKWIKRVTMLPIVLKGIMSSEDAQLAVELGVDAVWISNHGGRQLDTVLPTIDVLPGVVQAVGGKCQVFLDGGVNRGSDIMKALALGADMVFVGRAAIWGLAVDGEKGVAQVLQILKEELELCMGLSGTPSIPQLNSSMLLRA